MESSPSKLYSERTSTGVDKKVESLKKVISGETPAWEVSEPERAEILSREAQLAQELEQVSLLKTADVTFDTAYLQTAEGREDFQKITGLVIPDNCVDTLALKCFLYASTAALSEISANTLSELSGRTKKFRRTELYNSMASTMDELGNISVSAIPESDNLTIQLEVAKDHQREVKLRVLKEHIKQERETLRTVGKTSDYCDFLDGIYELYQRRINEMLALSASKFQNIKIKGDVIGAENLSVDERLALDERVVTDSFERDLSRYDKFLYGAGETNEAGWREQISKDLLAYAETYELQNNTLLGINTSSIKAKGLDSDKIYLQNIPVEAVAQKAMDTLAHYDLLSSEPAATYQVNRSGPAADNKWQVIVSTAFSKPSVNSEQKVVKIPSVSQSVIRLLTVIIAHEIEGHALQHENKAKIPLQFFKKIGSDRSSIFAEAGAMHNQEKVANEAFGVTAPAIIQYVKAMLVKLNGGSYADCVNEYYTSTIKGHQELLRTGEIDQTNFTKECKRKLRVAISSTSRLFAGNLSSSDTSRHLINSKDTVYLEQIRLATALKDSDLDDILYLTGINFDTLEFLLKAKLINLSEVQKPDYYALKIWKDMQDEYTLTV